MDEVPDFRFGVLFDAETTDKLLQVAAGKGIDPSLLLISTIDALYNHQHLVVTTSSE